MDRNHDRRRRRYALGASFSNNKSILIDGSNESVNTTINTHLDNNDNDWTISAWFKTTAVGGQFIYSEGRDFLDNNLITVQTNASKARVFVRNAAGTSVSLDSVGNVDDGLWHNIIGTKIVNLYSLYLDGSFETSVTTALGNIPIEHTGIGALYRSSLAAFFTGNIDEVSISDKGLSVAEVTELYNAGSPTNLAIHSAQANLTDWWRMGDKATFDGTDFTFPNQKGSDDGVSDNMEFEDVVNDAP